MFSKIGRLDRAIEAGERLRVKANLPVELLAQVLEQAQKIEARLIKLSIDANTAKASGRYSQAGLAEKVATFQQVAKDEYAKLSRLEDFDAMIKTMEVDLVNRAITERTKHAPADPALAYLQGKEIRDDQLAKRRQAEQARQDGKPYQDPVAELYLESCRNYDPIREAFLRAVTGAPWPVQILPEDIAEEGRQLIKEAISPELSTAIKCQKCLKTMHQELDAAVHEIIADPLRQAVRLEPHMLVADGMARPIVG